MTDFARPRDGENDQKQSEALLVLPEAPAADALLETTPDDTPPTTLPDTISPEAPVDDTAQEGLADDIAHEAPADEVPPEDPRQLDVFDPMFLAVRLQWLYEHIPDPITGENFNDYSLAERVSQVTSGRISLTPPALWGMRRGKHTPKWINMVAVAQAFNKSVAIFSEMPFTAFTDTVTHMQEDERLLALMQQSGVRHIMLRAADLPEESLTTLATIIEQVQNLVALQAQATPASSS